MIAKETEYFNCVLKERLNSFFKETTLLTSVRIALQDWQEQLIIGLF